MQCLDLIFKKRDGQQLSKKEIDFFISGLVKGVIPDYQAAALLMAIWFAKLDDRETANLTFSMRDSGEIIDLTDINGPKTDKHSSGGVGDTTTLIAAPIVSACGLKVAKMSGRGLGHTGGTLDKLESIPGLLTQIDMEEFKRIVSTCGLSIISQTNTLVPADKLLYALRDVTGTVDNTSLIAASIMSKKLASGSDAIVLDVKTGNGAFMKDIHDARILAQTMVDIGKKASKKMKALVTDMNQPLGCAIGNALEVKEAIEILQGEHEGDLKEVSMALAANMLMVGGVEKTYTAAVNKAAQVLSSGKALQKFEQMIAAQKGDPRVCQDTARLPKARKTIAVKAEKKGCISSIKTHQIGICAALLGAGRFKKSDTIDPGVGIWIKTRLGDNVEKGDLLAQFHVNDTKNVDQALQRFQDAVSIDAASCNRHPLIYDIIH